MNEIKRIKNWRFITLLTLITTSAVHADPLSDLKHLLNQARSKRDIAATELSNSKDRLQNAERKLSDAKTAVTSAAGRLTAEKNRLASTKNVASSVSTQVTQATDRLNQLKSRLTSAQSLVNSINQEKANLQNQVNQWTNQYRALVDQALNTKILAYSLNTEGKLSYNFKTGSFFGQIDLGNGFTLDNKKIEGWLSGTVSIPRGNPVQFLMSAATMQQMQHETQYAAKRGNFFGSSDAPYKYYASNRFVEWASAETAAHHVILGIATAGKSVQQSIREAQDQLLLEFNDVVAWLMESGEQEMENAATCALSVMLGESCSGRVPFSVSTRMEGVGCTYKGKSSWATSIPAQWLPGLTLPSLHASVASSHLGFGLNWSSGLGGVSSLRSRVENFKSGATLQSETERLFKIAMAKLLSVSSEKAQKYLSQFNYAEVMGGLNGQTQINRMMSDLGLTSNDLMARFQEGNPIIDLKGTRVSQTLEQKLQPLAQGNEGKATVTQLEFDLSSMSLNVGVNFLHRQSWGRLEDAIEALNDWYRSKSVQLRVAVEDLFSSAAKSAISAAQNKLNAAKSGLTAALNRLNQATSAVQSAAGDVAQAGDALKALQNRLRDLNQAIEALKNSVSSLQSKLDSAAARVGDLTNAVNAAKNAVGRAKDQLDHWKDEVESLERKIRNFVPPLPTPSVPNFPNVPVHIPHPHWP